MKALITLILIAGWSLLPFPCSAQDLGELARQERLRRAAAAPVHHRIDNLSDASLAKATASTNAGPERLGNARNPEPASDELRAAAAAANDKQRNDLIRRGPVVWLELGKANRRLTELEKELVELERTSTPTWRNGMKLENPLLEKKRREVQTCRRRLQEVDQEWKWLQDRARRLDLAPGILRGYR
jgi:hypothetical protein